MQLKRLEYNEIITYEANLKRKLSNLVDLSMVKEDPIAEVEKTYKNMLAYTKDMSANIIGAYLNDSFVGFIWGYKTKEDSNKVHINYFFVDENYRGNGIGTELLDALEKIFNHVSFELLVLKNNTKAINFYRNNGFEIIDEYDTKYKMQKNNKC